MSEAPAVARRCAPSLGVSSLDCPLPHGGGLFYGAHMTFAVMIVSLFIGFVAGVGVVLWWDARSIARVGR